MSLPDFSLPFQFLGVHMHIQSLHTQEGPVEIYSEDWEPDLLPEKQKAYLVYRSFQNEGTLCTNRNNARQIQRNLDDGNPRVHPVAISPELKLKLLKVSAICVNW